MPDLKPFAEPVLVGRPLLPDLTQFQADLEQIWTSKWLTNHGARHNELERRLTGVLKVPHLSIFNNGTLALLVALKALDLPAASEVITTPFTFPATPHCLTWNGLIPVFCDITSDSMVLDADRIERLITPATSAILGVHVYGFPCDVERIGQIARRHNLRVIYDAAHAFTTEIDGRGIGSFGDVSMFSFHATKLYHTVEGGCLTYNEAALRDKIYFLRNFGIKNEEEVVDVGINGKLNELQAALGLLNLDLFEPEKIRRAEIRRLYENHLGGLDGLTVPKLPARTTDSNQYFVIRIDGEKFGVSRDELYRRLKEYNIFARKYFYPLCSEYQPYRGVPSGAPDRLPVANRVKTEVLCLPYYGGLTNEDVVRICAIIRRIRDGGS